MSKVYRTNSNKLISENDLLNAGELLIDSIEKIRAARDTSFASYSEAQSKFDDDSYDEEFEDTLSRKYDEGYSDALAMVIALLTKENN